MRPACFREVREYPADSVDSAVIVRIARRRRLKVVRVDEAGVALRCRLSFRSFGESVNVALGNVKGHCLVDITSTCVLPTQIADWGKNERNVRLLFEDIEAFAGVPAPGEKCPLCRQCGYLLVGLETSTCPECGHPFSPGEPSAPQEGATFRIAFLFALAITALEIALVGLLKLAGVGLFLAGGHTTYLRLLLLNMACVFAVVALHRLVKWLRRR